MSSKERIREFIRWELAARDHIDLKRCYVDVACGDLPAGVLLSQIVYWFLPSRETGAHKTTVEFDARRWLVKGRNEWWAECRLTPKQFDRAIKLLRAENLVDTCVAVWKGETTLHITLEWETFIKRVRFVVDHPLEKPSTRKGKYFQRKEVLTKGEEVSSPKVKTGIDQRLNPITKSTSKSTTKNTSSLTAKKRRPKKQQTPDPPPPTDPTPKPESDHSRLMRELFELTGPIPDGGAQGKAIKWLLEKHGVEKSSACLFDLVAELRDPNHWRTSRVSLLTVQKEIGSWQQTGRKPNLSLVGRGPSSNEPPAPREELNIEISPRMAELSSRDRTQEETDELLQLIDEAKAKARSQTTTTTTNNRRAKHA